MDDMISLPSAPRLPLQVPTLELELSCIPVIDLSRLHQHCTARALVIQDIGQACRRLGCFQVTNHGINKAVIAGALESASDFFQLSEEAKAEFTSEDVAKPVRYSAGAMGGLNDKPRAFLKHYAHPLSEWAGIWPPDPLNYRETMGEYATEVRKVALQLMDAILESLGLGQAYLREKLEAGMQVLALNSYPQRSEPLEFLLGMAPHSDYGCITILAQSCQGLQIFDKNAEAWKAVSQIPDTLHVHTGDYLEVLSNGRYKSVVHQAVLTTDRRISIASIHSLSMDEKVTIAKELVDEQHPKEYQDSSFRDFLNYISNTGISKGRSFIDSLRITDA